MQAEGHAPGAGRAVGGGLEQRAEVADAGLQQLRVALADGALRQLVGLCSAFATGPQQQQRAVQRLALPPLLPDVKQGELLQSHGDQAGSVKLGSAGSVTARSRSQPSFSSLMCWMATALALASRSGRAWYSDTQQRNSL